MRPAAPAAARRAVLADALAGLRLDQALAATFPEHSRSHLKAQLAAGAIRVDGRSPRPREPVRGGELVEFDVGTGPAVAHWGAEAIALPILHEDEEILVIDKPAGLVVHPGAGNLGGTLVNALMHHAPELAALPRAGLVHRLDRDTSGVMVVARTRRAHASLVRQILKRRMGREYRALAWGDLTGGGTIDAPLGRHPTQRTRMAVVEGGRHAVTHYRLLGRFRGAVQLACRLETGRTHQIRVHLAHIGRPLVGDPVYGGRPRTPAGASAALVLALRAFGRQALHAERLTLEHPGTRVEMVFEAPLPPDLASLLAAFGADLTGARPGPSR